MFDKKIEVATKLLKKLESSDRVKNITAKGIVVNNTKKRAGKISMIAEGIELAEQKKDFFSIYR